MGRLFGTDGIRGVANTELTCELAVKVGKAAAKVLISGLDNRHPKVLIGRDTRISGNMLEGALGAGFCSMGVNVVLLGAVPTPAVAHLVQECGADAGVMISASHNPAEYNGIKIFNGDGFKLSDELEDKIEDMMNSAQLNESPPTGGELGHITSDKQAVHNYIEKLMSTIESDLSGMSIALDCANGSASSTARELFEGLGADIHVLADQPDGVNINLDCGSTHMDMLTEFVIENKCDVGFAFDGDADRCLAVDETGSLIDGDNIMAIISNQFKQDGKLNKNAVVATVMSNMGFFKFASEYGIECVTTKVGDRYVLEEMLKNGYSIGGEQSGHIIFLDHANTGDGQLTAVQLAAILKKTGKPASKLAAIMNVYPQVLINVKVSPEGKEKLKTDREIADTIKSVEQELDGDGRVLVRASGTEPLIRVMMEGRVFDQIEPMAKRIADLIAERLS